MWLSLGWQLSVFSLPVCLIVCWFCKEKLGSCQSWKLKVECCIHLLIHVFIAFSLQLKEDEDSISMTESRNLGHFFRSKIRKFSFSWFFLTHEKLRLEWRNSQHFSKGCCLWFLCCILAVWVLDCSVACWWGKKCAVQFLNWFCFLLVMCVKTREPFSRLLWIISGS